MPGECRGTILFSSVSDIQSVYVIGNKDDSEPMK